MLPEQMDFQHEHAALLSTVSSDLEARLGIRVPSIHTDLFETGSLDSLSFVNLLSYIESEHGIAINFAELDFQTVSSVESICRLIASQAPDGTSKQAEKLEGWAS
jgi:acyl carrier protein